MKKIILCCLILSQYQWIKAQSVGVGTTTPNNSAVLDVTSTTKGLLIPRMTGAQRSAIPGPVAGMIVYQTNTETSPASSPGFYFHAGGGAAGGWRRIAKADEITTSGWAISGNDQFSTVSGGVGIGTGNPHVSSLLELNSTSKGFLLPRMSSAERTGITSPATGLMVFDITTNSLWVFTSGVWTQLGSGGASPWQTNGINVYNSNTGNVGIGVTNPARKLDLSGNMRIANSSTPTISFESDDVFSSSLIEFKDQSGNLKASITSSAGMIELRSGSNSNQLTVTPTGAVGMGSTSVGAKLDINAIGYSQDILRLNDENPTIQLQSSGVNKGYYQLSGNNVRLGTNSGNLTGNLIIRMDGTDRVFVDEAGRVGIGISNPGSRLQVAGDINGSGNLLLGGNILIDDNSKVNKPLTGTKDLLPICYGRVRFQATSSSMTSNVTVARLSTGVYELTCPDFNANTCILVTMNEYQGGFYAYPNVENWPAGSTTYRISFYNISVESPRDVGFSFVAYR